MQCAGPDAAVLAQARALTDWHDRHGYCANCGSPTEPREAGYVRACVECSAQHFPRTAPVTLMLVLRGDRVPPGRQPRFAPMPFPAPAGFVATGRASCREIG